MNRWWTKLAGYGRAEVAGLTTGAGADPCGRRPVCARALASEDHRRLPVDGVDRIAAAASVDSEFVVLVDLSSARLLRVARTATVTLRHQQK